MKRLFLSAGMALALHGLIFLTEPEWLNDRFSFEPEPNVVTLSLVNYQPRRPEVKPKVKSVPIPAKKAGPALTKTKPMPKPKPLAPVKKPRPTLTKTEPMPRPKPLEPVKKSRPALTKTEPMPGPKPLAPVKPAPDFFTDVEGDIVEEELSDTTRQMPILPLVEFIREAIPIYRENPKPRYPESARRRGYQGTVVLDVLVDDAGNVETLRLFKSSGHNILDKAALRSVQKWRFEPGIRGSDKVKMWVRVPIRFHLE